MSAKRTQVESQDIRDHDKHVLMIKLLFLGRTRDQRQQMPPPKSHRLRKMYKMVLRKIDDKRRLRAHCTFRTQLLSFQRNLASMSDDKYLNRINMGISYIARAHRLEDSQTPENEFLRL